MTSERSASWQAVREQHARYIVLQEELGYTTDRSSEEYKWILMGYGALFKYVSQITPVLIDVGAGTTRAVHEISQEYHQLNCWATTLTDTPEIKHHLGRERTFITCAEEMADCPVAGCVLGVYSITYCVNADLAVMGIDKVLVPGGVVKAAFSPYFSQVMGAQPADKFITVWRAMGYGVAVRANHSRRNDVVVAIKGRPQLLAQALLDEDERLAIYDSKLKGFGDPGIISR